jgi:septal ring factor EnvC (AmiA/AmiB activator)
MNDAEIAQAAEMAHLRAANDTLSILADDIATLANALAEARAEIARLRARAELAESQRDYWISEAEKHGHGPDGDDVPVGLFDEEEGDDAEPVD